MQVMPGSSCSVVAEAKDLNPRRVRLFRYTWAPHRCHTRCRCWGKPARQRGHPTVERLRAGDHRAAPDRSDAGGDLSGRKPATSARPPYVVGAPETGGPRLDAPRARRRRRARTAGARRPPHPALAALRGAVRRRHARRAATPTPSRPRAVALRRSATVIHGLRRAARRARSGCDDPATRRATHLRRCAVGAAPPADRPCVPHATVVSTASSSALTPLRRPHLPRRAGGHDRAATGRSRRLSSAGSTSRCWPGSPHRPTGRPGSTCATSISSACCAGRRDPRDAVPPEVTEAWRLLRATGGRCRVDDVARRVGWSRRHLAGRFAAEHGIGPKQAARLMRFEHARGLVLSGGRLADVAARTGYADQAPWPATAGPGWAARRRRS